MTTWTSAGYSHVIEYEQFTKFVGWQKCSFRTTPDAVELHLAALWIRSKFGHVRHICVGLVTN